MANDILTKIKSTADILGGAIFFASAEGVDPEYPNNGDLLPNGMYIRLVGSDNSVAYVSAHELDKLINITGQTVMGKANQVDVDILTQSLADKASATELQLLASDVATKASKGEVDNLLDTFEGKADQAIVDEIIAQLATKANQTDVDTLEDLVATKANQTDVDTLTESVGTKASAATVATILEDIRRIQELLKILECEDWMGPLNSQISLLSNEIKKKLNIDDIVPINTEIGVLHGVDDQLSERLDVVETNLSKKATNTYVQSEIDKLINTTQFLNNELTKKADKLTVSEEKANKADLNTVNSKVAEINEKLHNIEVDIDGIHDNLAEEISKKADTATLSQDLAAINSALEQTVSRSAFSRETTNLSNKIDALTTTHSTDFNNLYTRVENIDNSATNSISELRGMADRASKSISDHTNEISKLKETTSNQTEQLKQNWVRVLSTKEYKNLRTPSEGAPYHDRYKYPNVVYFVVDYNKPKKIYIGDILIAEAEQNGSTGFAYNFPIIF